MKLFHYTDAVAVKSILEFNVVRLTDMKYLNDSEEVSHATRIIIDDISKGKLNHRLHKDYAELASEYVIGQFTNLLEKKFSGHPIYSVSFSAAPDLLSQWRSYGSYAIEIDKSKWSVFLNECLYEIKKVRGRLFKPTIDALRAVGRDLRDYAGRLEYIGTESYMDLIKVLATVKHPGFEEEKEWRLLLDDRSEHSTDIQYRVRSDMLVPYIEVAMPLECITAVHLGPMKYQDMAFSSMSEFVDRLCAFRGLNKNIEVLKSHIPYRAA